MCTIYSCHINIYRKVIRDKKEVGDMFSVSYIYMTEPLLQDKE